MMTSNMSKIEGFVYTTYRCKYQENQADAIDRKTGLTET